MTRPLLALVADPGTAEPVRPLVRALAPLVDVRSLHRCERRPDGVLATSPGAAARAPEGVPLAVWVTGASDLAPAGSLAVGPAPGPAGVAVPVVAVDVSAHPPLAPHVRARWRERFGLPTPWVVDLATLAPARRRTAMAVASVVLAGEADLPVALALGAPTVCAAEVAATVGAEPGVHLVLGDLAEARALAGDPHRSAALSASAHRFARAQLDLAASAAGLVARLGLGAPAGGPRGRLAARLAELGGPPSGRAHRRALTAAAPFTSDGASP